MKKKEDIVNNEEEEEEEEFEEEPPTIFDIQIGEDSFLLLIGKTEENKLLIKLVDKEEDNNKIFYQNEFSLLDLRKINSFFNKIKNEDEAFDFIKKNMNESEKEIKIIDQEKIKLVFSIKQMNKINIKFILYKMSIDSEEENQEGVPEKKEKEDDQNGGINEEEEEEEEEEDNKEKEDKKEKKELIKIDNKKENNEDKLKDKKEYKNKDNNNNLLIEKEKELNKIKKNIENVPVNSKISKVIDELKDNLDSLEGAVNCIEQEQEENNHENKKNEYNKINEFILFKEDILKRINYISKKQNESFMNLEKALKEEVNNKIKEMKSELNKIGINNLNENINLMKNIINENKKKITVIEKKINDENEKLEKKIENLNEELKNKENEKNNTLKELNIKENEMNSSIKNSNNQINIIEKIIYDEIKISISNIEQKINEMKGYNNELKKDLSENKLIIENNNKLFNEQFNHLNQKIEQNENYISLLKDKDNFDKKLIQLENNFNNFELKIKNLEVNYEKNEIEKDKVIKSEKINGLEDKLNNFEIKLNKDLDKAYEKINNLMSELNKKNDNMHIIFDNYEVLNNKINKFENSFKLIDEKSIKTIENENILIKRIDDLENEIKIKSKESNEMKIKINSLINSKENLENLIKELNDNIKRIEHKNKSLIKKKINNKQNSSFSVGKLHNNKINLAAGDILINNKDEEFQSDKNDINQEKLNRNKEINNDLIAIQRKEMNNYESENSEIKYNTINSYGGVNIPFTSLENTINESKIIQYSDIIFIEKRIKEIHPKIKNVLFNLVYRVTDDGDKSTDFHNRCDKIGPNITFVKTKKGYIFGGFTFKNWEHLQRDINIDKPNLGSASRDSRAFGFSINLKKIYNNEKPNEFAIWCNRNYGPTFKNNFFQIFDDCLQKGGYCSIKNNSHFAGQNSDYEISGGESRFGVEELEVYEVQLQ